MPERKPRSRKPKPTIQDMVMYALEAQGGTAYLRRHAEENPSAFLDLVGRVLGNAHAAKSKREGKA